MDRNKLSIFLLVDLFLFLHFFLLLESPQLYDNSSLFKTQFLIHSSDSALYDDCIKNRASCLYNLHIIEAWTLHEICETKSLKKQFHNLYSLVQQSANVILYGQFFYKCDEYILLGVEETSDWAWKPLHLGFEICFSSVKLVCGNKFHQPGILTCFSNFMFA